MHAARMYTSTTEGPLSACDVSVLSALYELGRRSRPVHMRGVARRAGVSVAAAEAALLRLERRGLVWAARARLSLLGLAVAARLAARPARLESRTRAA
jgi:DNA-binding MarR family transcriptional regulator